MGMDPFWILLAKSNGLIKPAFTKILTLSVLATTVAPSPNLSKPKFREGDAFFRPDPCSF